MYLNLPENGIGGITMRSYALTILALIFFVAVTIAQASPPRKIVVFEPEIVNEPAQEALLRAVGAIIVKNLPLITGKAILLPPQAEAVLGTIPGVVRIDPDVIVEAYKGPPSDKVKPPKESEPPPEQYLPWGIDRIDAELVWETSTGTGVKVAIIDTGIDLDHPDLKANIKDNVNIINSRKTGDDDHGHGTHVAGTVAAIDNEIGVVGVAPQAELYAVKALDRKGSGFLSDVIAGLEWCIANDMQVVNMSLGTSVEVQSLHDAVIAVNEAGIIQVASAGNEYGGPVGYPAAYDEVIAVSATDNTDTIADFSSVGPKVELAAPGVNIPSTWKGGDYKTISGTSMAAPHVTGTIALVLVLAIDQTDVRAILEATADDLGSPGEDGSYGYGLVDAEQATTGIQTQAAPPKISRVGKIATTWAKIKNQ
jgi:subtilisin family serine protease